MGSRIHTTTEQQQQLANIDFGYVRSSSMVLCVVGFRAATLCARTDDARYTNVRDGFDGRTDGLSFVFHS